MKETVCSDLFHSAFLTEPKCTILLNYFLFNSKNRPNTKKKAHGSVHRKLGFSSKKIKIELLCKHRKVNSARSIGTTKSTKIIEFSEISKV
jgi:hypothetical protein